MKTQRGMVSLMTTIIVGILLVIIVTGMVSLMIGELRQASDASLSIRAYYSAEAGVEDALLRIKKALEAGSVLPNTGCVSQNLGNDNEYTCQRITSTTNELIGDLEREQPLQIDMASVAGIRRVEVSWNLTGRDSALPFSTPLGFPRGDGGAWQAPAVIEFSMASYREVGGLINPADVRYETTVLKPRFGGGGPPFSMLSNSGPVEVACTASVDYNCRAVIRIDDPARSYILRLKPRYAGTHYKVQAFTCIGGCNPADLPDQNATIDVTARAGQVYRRIVVKVPVRAGVAAVDYVLFSDTDICKNFKVREFADFAQAEVGCGPSTFD